MHKLSQIHMCVIFKTFKAPYSEAHDISTALLLNELNWNVMLGTDKYLNILMKMKL